MRITWDEKNAEEHWRKHSIRFSQAQQVFFDPNNITEPDRRFDYGENRYWTLGMVEGYHLLLYVAHTMEENGELVITIISAREAKPRERRIYGNRKF
ncbi:MAG: BrnT family toxin [Holophagaceae bacterium]|nr:BrnT family toxin [Holophagaceae bacterium]